MNVMLSIDDELLARAHDLAARRGTSLNQLIQDYLQKIALDVSADELIAELTDLWATNSSESGGSSWTRAEIHERSGLH
jgi:hypothetical protein